VLSVADRRWIDFLTQAVNDTWDPTNPGRPKTLGYLGSEEFIRLQFEEYLLALLSSAKYHFYLQSQPANSHKAVLSDIDGDPATDFNLDWLEAWQHTENFRIFQKFTDSHLFDIVEPRHPCAGGLTIEDVQRRLTQQITELHLDERFSTGKEALNKHLATGQKKVSSAFNNLWADIEVMREAQRKRTEEQRAAYAANPDLPLHRSSTTPSAGSATWDNKSQTRGADLSSHAQAVGQRAGAYISSWGAWASERRKGWAKPSANVSISTVGSPAPSTEPGSPQKMKSGGIARLRSVTEKRRSKDRDRERAEVSPVEGGRRGDGIGRLDA
jgi:hypothetical protein